jgi:hypothetical protein
MDVSATRSISREFGELSVKGKMLCALEMLGTYCFPAAGVVAYVVLRLKGKGRVYRFFALAGAAAAITIYVVEFVSYAITAA